MGRLAVNILSETHGANAYFFGSNYESSKTENSILLFEM